MEVRKKLEELAAVTKELDANAKMQQKAANIVAAEQLKKKVSELSESQSRLMAELVNWHPDKERRDQYFDLARTVDELPAQIKACKEIEVLRELEKTIEQKTNDMIYCFQTIVADLMGGKPPDEPVFD